MLNVIMLNVIMLNVIMLSVIMFSVIMLNVMAAFKLRRSIFEKNDERVRYYKPFTGVIY